MSRALITGIAGQDGSYLSELLLGHGYEVAGVVRRDPGSELPNLAPVRDRVELVEADLLDREAPARLLRELRPQEVYHLASPSFVPRSWEQPLETAELAAVGLTALLEAAREADPAIRLCLASSSAIFGEARESPQTEETPLAPLSPYGAAKAYGHLLAGAYRRRYGLHVSCAILYNHESPRRPLDFVTSKVADGAARISLGLARELVLGDLEARRDWGFAGDYVEAMRLMLRQDEPGDYVVATGTARTVRELVEVAFGRLGLDWREHVRHDPALDRGPSERQPLAGDATRARERLGWRPRVSFEELVHMLVDAAVARLTGP